MRLNSLNVLTLLLASLLYCWGGIEQAGTNTTENSASSSIAFDYFDHHLLLDGDQDDLTTIANGPESTGIICSQLYSIEHTQVAFGVIQKPHARAPPCLLA